VWTYKVVRRSDLVFDDNGEKKHAVIDWWLKITPDIQKGGGGDVGTAEHLNRTANGSVLLVSLFWQRGVTESSV